MSTLEITHPRPRLRRDRWTSLDGTWRFATDPDDRGLRDGWHRGDWNHDAVDITVPFAPQVEASGVTDFDGSAVVWYSRTITRPDDAGADDLVWLHFGAVDHSCDVWIDGDHVAHHVGGSTPFRAEVSRLLTEGEHELVVRVLDDPRHLDHLVGKQHWLGGDRSIWYVPTTGIWQPVWLEPVAVDHLTDLVVTPDVTTGTLDLEVVVAGGPGSVVEVTASFDGTELVWSAGRVDLDGRARLALRLARQHAELRGDDMIDAGGVKLWTPEHPNLYQLEVVVKRDGEVTDTVSSHAGMRSIEVIDGKLCLNKRPYEQRLVLDQGYWARTGLTAPDAAALVRDVELAKELGFNGARKHQKIEDPRWLYAADVLGFLVWDELPAGYAFTPELVGELTRDLQRLIARDRSHPCVVAWVPMNESWGTNDLTDPRQQSLQRTLYDLAHALDGTRPVIGNDGWELVASDIVTIHDYRNPQPIAEGYTDLDKANSQYPARRRFVIGPDVHADAPWLLTEFGGISLVEDEGWGYHSVNTPEQLLERVVELIEAIRSSGRWQGYCYTQLTDVGTELNGLLTLEREHKLDAPTLKAMQTDTGF
ncbi:glycoside hydrolase family 2 protein [Aestuariimicrobium ganziense]|uniref:glycoside hydrolase family 2 protein n=1 Tax=Aestuariimicrobium ganziense TaxID=2773677 RepID=UPI00194069D7|nr:sugar-binding domain-containing protein [Aestuariimicrobium ganziense]